VSPVCSDFVVLRLRRQQKKKRMHMMSEPPAVPTPIPASAPVESPLLLVGFLPLFWAGAGVVEEEPEDEEDAVDEVPVTVETTCVVATASIKSVLVIIEVLVTVKVVAALLVEVIVLTKVVVAEIVAVIVDVIVDCLLTRIFIFSSLCWIKSRFGEFNKARVGFESSSIIWLDL
jgi:hypothetical protein